MAGWVIDQSTAKSRGRRRGELECPVQPLYASTRIPHVVFLCSLTHFFVLVMGGGGPVERFGFSREIPRNQKTTTHLQNNEESRGKTTWGIQGWGRKVAVRWLGEMFEAPDLLYSVTFIQELEASCRCPLRLSLTRSVPTRIPFKRDFEPEGELKRLTLLKKRRDRIFPRSGIETELKRTERRPKLHGLASLPGWRARNLSTLGSD